ncbi:MAG TPA: amidoligase family protein [Methanosarcina sp.]|nr:amidoligase family protein [Methanosarcina sp.]
MSSISERSVAEYFDIPLRWSITEQPGFVCGIEYEIENISSYSGGFLEGSGIHVTSDHSLRNNGVEFITNPGTKEQQLNMLKALKSTLVFKPDGEAFTERTSVHVHVNMRPLTLRQVKQFLFLYVLAEPFLFKCVGDERKNSIFCTPLQHTYLPKSYKKDLPSLVSMWHKYTAFNLCPLASIGTIEFRHMFGTINENIINQWLSILEGMYNYVIKEDANVLREVMLGNTKTILKESIPFDVFSIINDQDLINPIIDLKLTTV